MSSRHHASDECDEWNDRQEIDDGDLDAMDAEIQRLERRWAAAQRPPEWQQAIDRVLLIAFVTIMLWWVFVG